MAGGTVERLRIDVSNPRVALYAVVVGKTVRSVMDCRYRCLIDENGMTTLAFLLGRREDYIHSGYGVMA